MEGNRDMKYMCLSLGIATIASFICLLVDYRISIGIIVGSVAYFCNYMIMVSQLDVMLLHKNFRLASFVFFYLIRCSLLFVPMLLAVIRPDRCNVFAVFGSMLLFKVIMYIQGIRKKVM